MARARARARAERAANEYYPLDSRDGSDLFDILSGPHIASGLRKRIGEFLYERGFFATPEFRRAEERLEYWPASQWYKQQVTPTGCHEDLFARWRDPIVCLADTFRNPDLRPEEDCVWGPELLRDEMTRSHDRHNRGYISEVWHGEWCVLPRVLRACARPQGRARPWQERFICCRTGFSVLEW